MATRSTDKPTSTGPTAAGAEALSERTPVGAQLDPRLRAELQGPRWEQSWELTPSIHTPALDPAARQQWWTLEQMLYPFARDALALADDRIACDLRCGEGWIAQRLLRWGARGVLAIDDRPERLRRARLLRDHFAIPAAELDLLDDGERPEADRSFDVVVLVGAADRLGGEPELLGRARAATRSICAIETHGDDSDRVARAALAAGFDAVDRVRPPAGGAPLYVLERRDLLIAKVAPAR